MCLLLGFFLQVYWLVPMMRLWDSLTNMAPAKVAKTALQRAWKVVEAEMQGLRMNGGALMRSSTQGLHQLKNPSEQRTGKDRFMRLAEEIGPWPECGQALAAIFKPLVCYTIKLGYNEWVMPRFMGNLIC